MRKIIELKGISRTYGNGSQARTVLKNVDLTIAAGEMVAIIGASGSGKSTLIKLLTAEIRQTNGRVIVNGFFQLNNG